MEDMLTAIDITEELLDMQGIIADSDDGSKFHNFDFRGSMNFIK